MTGLVYRPPPVKYTLIKDGEDKGEEKDMKLYIMAIANGTFLGGNMRIAPKADISDGQVWLKEKCLQTVGSSERPR